MKQLEVILVPLQPDDREQFIQSYLLITVQINEFAEKGSYGIACAFASILILITYSSVLIMNLIIKKFGTSKKVNLD